MNKLGRYLYIPALLPMCLVLVLSLFNLNKRTKIQFLVWQTPDIPVGALILLASTSTFFVGSIPYLILNQPQIQKSRKVKVENYSPPIQSPVSNLENLETDNYMNTDTYIERDIREPAPTIPVPFRVIQMKQNSASQINVTDSYSLNNEDYIEQSSNETTNSNFASKHDPSDWSDNLDEHW